MAATAPPPPPRHPRIQSLSSFQVAISPEVADTLRSQYEGGEMASHEHFQKILQQMKTPPRQTVLRLVHPQDSRQRVMEDMGENLEEWIEKSGGTGLVRSLVRGHSIFEDVILVDLEETTSATATPGESLFAQQRPHPSRYPVLFPNWPLRRERGWPLTHRVVIVSRQCGEAVLRGADIFVRGVLAADKTIQPDEAVAVYADLTNNSRSISRGLVLDHYVGECLFLGVGTSHCSRADYFSQSSGVAIRMSVLPHERAGPLLPPLDELLGTCLYAQNLPSIMAGHVLQPQPGDVIFDMCAAPGGKTSHIARLADFGATIVMSDKSRRKVVTARQLFRKLGCDSCIFPLHLDGTRCVERRTDILPRSVSEILATATVDTNDGLRKVDKFFPGTFDRILLDPPCALGLRPKLIVGQRTTKELLSFATYQKRFIREAVDLLKVQGTLVYSTCTIHAPENEGMVHYILENYPEMELLPISVNLAGPGLAGCGLSPADCSKVRRFDPIDASDTMGFFIAAFQKKAT